MLARTALGGIWVYQRFLSPRKGFRCAYAVLHGGTGCSGYAKHAIAEHGALAAIPLVRQRFKDCKTAHFTLRDDGEDQKKRKKSTWFNTCDCASGCAPGPFPASCTPFGGASAGKTASGCDAADCNAIDCGGCDGCSCS